MAQLIPICTKLVYPGDRFRVGLTYQMQLAPMFNPVYDGLTVNFEAFFVPHRIIDRKWREFWTSYNQYDQMTPTEISPLTYTVSVRGSSEGPVAESDSVTGNGIGRSSLMNYLGLQFSQYDNNGMPSSPQGTITGSVQFNAIKLLAYHRIYDDWYRNERTQRASLYDYYNETPDTDRNISETIAVSEGSVNVPDLLKFHVRNYAKDRFTTALPEPIIGGDVRIPTGEGFARIAGNSGLLDGAYASTVNSTSGQIDTVVGNSAVTGGQVSLNALALGTIQQLKFAFKEYEFRMKDTYNGNRYVESIESHYGVRVPDSTLQRSLYLGSARDYVNFGEVYQTSAGNGDNLSQGALGDFAGRGNANGTHYMFDETFYEPGYFFIIFSIAPKARYFQGVSRDLVRFDRDDYFSPEYQNIGDDFIENRELFYEFNPQNNVNDGVFGFQTRWYDLKSSYDELHGDFADIRSTGVETVPVPGPMMSWTFSRWFSTLPVISDKFSSIPVINRPFIETDERNDNYFVDVAFNIDALRPILTTETF